MRLGGELGGAEVEGRGALGGEGGRSRELLARSAAERWGRAIDDTGRGTGGRAGGPARVDGAAASPIVVQGPLATVGVPGGGQIRRELEQAAGVGGGGRLVEG